MKSMEKRGSSQRLAVEVRNLRSAYGQLLQHCSENDYPEPTLAAAVECMAVKATVATLKISTLISFLSNTKSAMTGALVATESWKTRFPVSKSCPEALVAIDSWKNRFPGAPTKTTTTTTSEALVAADSWENLPSARAPGPLQSRRVSFDHVGELPSPSTSALEKMDAQG